eukprot:gene19082-25682_t
MTRELWVFCPSNAIHGDGSSAVHLDGTTTVHIDGTAAARGETSAAVQHGVSASVQGDGTAAVHGETPAAVQHGESAAVQGDESAAVQGDESAAVQSEKMTGARQEEGGKWGQGGWQDQGPAATPTVWLSGIIDQLQLVTPSQANAQDGREVHNEVRVHGAAPDLCGAQGPGSEQIHGEVHASELVQIVETKTKKQPNKGGEASRRSARLQVLIYHQMYETMRTMSYDELAAFLRTPNRRKGEQSTLDLQRLLGAAVQESCTATFPHAKVERYSELGEEIHLSPMGPPGSGPPKLDPHAKLAAYSEIGKEINLSPMGPLNEDSPTPKSIPPAPLAPPGELGSDRQLSPLGPLGSGPPKLDPNAKVPTLSSELDSERHLSPMGPLNEDFPPPVPVPPTPMGPLNEDFPPPVPVPPTSLGPPGSAPLKMDPLNLLGPLGRSPPKMDSPGHLGPLGPSPPQVDPPIPLCPSPPKMDPPTSSPPSKAPNADQSASASWNLAQVIEEYHQLLSFLPPASSGINPSIGDNKAVNYPPHFIEASFGDNKAVTYPPHIVRYLWQQGGGKVVLGEDVVSFQGEWVYV